MFRSDSDESFSTTSFSDGLEESAFDLLLVGGGPRSIIQVTSEIIFMLLYRQHFEELINLGAQYYINTLIVEKQRFIGVGGAYNAGQTGMMNTGVEADITFPVSLPSTSTGMVYLMDFLSYKKRYERFIGKHEEAYYHLVKKFNLPGAIMFKRSIGPASATPNGHLAHEGAYLMRRTVGEEEVANFHKVKKLANALLPFYKLHIMESTTLRSLMVHKNGQQIASVQTKGEGFVEYVTANQVRLNTGTVSRNPISDPAVRKLMFCQPMNVDHFKQFCSAHDLLDEYGFLKAGKKMLSGGMGLSGLDEISMLDGVMKIFEEDPNSLLGYKVREEAKQKYKGAITIVSRTQGRACYPRHSHTAEWQQDSPAMGNSKQVHALFLHNYGEELYRIWIDVIIASVARARQSTPDQVSYKRICTKSLLRSQFEGTKWFLELRKRAGEAEMAGNLSEKQTLLRESTKTLYGAWRQAALCLIFGFGLEEDFGKAAEAMSEFAPITWKGREVWLFHRSQTASLTDERFAATRSNRSHFQNWAEMMRHVTSSPVEIHSMFHLLLESGIANHEVGEFSSVKTNVDGDKVCLKGIEYDSFLVAPVFDHESDGVAKSLANQVKSISRKHWVFGKVGKFRRYLDNDGNALPIADNGLGGKGFDEHTKFVDSHEGSFAADVNNRGSGISVASSFTLRRMALAHLKAAGIPAPEKVVDEIYEGGKPDVDSYTAEVEKFRSHFEEAFETWAYLRAIKLVAGSDAQKYASLYDEGLTKDSRNDRILKMSGSSDLLTKRAVELYKEEVRNTPTYHPPSRDEYLARFVDTTLEEDVHIYTEAMKMAKEHLSKQQA
ncbi:unnamed protein product [Agarophyton chilense]|eukprot:gb/GEZJ01001314.1/.p1 GENE.gb/GEZJ01001314.1/~~gb/GEZJ01001314.1/.p1  ORF type:complete len:834 (-),score=118.39 gb/GEZJ01001314.1/:1017-3518(-)